MEVGTMITLFVFLGVVCEQIVKIANNIRKKKIKNAILQIVSVLSGILLAFTFSLDIFILVGLVARYQWVATIITGILIGGLGSGIHDIFKWLEPIPTGTFDTKEIVPNEVKSGTE
mgnify:CR=1 FL=1